MQVPTQGDSRYSLRTDFGREVRLHLRLPGSGLGEIDYPHLYPSPPKEFPGGYDQTSSSSAGFWSSSSPTQSSTDRQYLLLGWYFYLAEIWMKRIFNNLLVWRYNFRSGRESLDQGSKDFGLEQNVVEFKRQVQGWSVDPIQLPF